MPKEICNVREIKGEHMTKEQSYLMIHNIACVRSRAGWTNAQVLKALADAKVGIRYQR